MNVLGLLAVVVVLAVAAVVAAVQERRRARREAVRAMLAEQRAALDSIARIIGEQLAPAFTAMIPAMREAAQAIEAFGRAWTGVSEP